MRISWTVDDGYAGGTRPQSLNIDDDELRECESIEEAQKLIDDYVQDEFEMNIHWVYTRYDSMIAELKNLLDNPNKID